MDLEQLIAGFRGTTTPSISDAVDKLTGRRGYLDHEIQGRISDRKIVGPAVTVLEGPTDQTVPPTHALEAIDTSPAGSIVVISIGGYRDVAVWGGLMTAGAVANRLGGAVLDGGLRDIAEIRRDHGEFQVFSRSVSPATTLGRFRTIAANVPVPVGDVTVNPGDLVVGDLDGVVVVPRAQAEAVLAMAQEIDRREAEQARLILEARSLRQGLARYNRI